MADCPTCVHANEHGDWGPTHRGLTHCRRCHGSWAMATEFQHCTACCRTFSTVGAADLHRKAGPGRMVRCIDPPLVRARDGRPLLVESRRSRAAGTTVTIWARADATGWRGQPTPDPQDAPRRGRVMQRAAHLPEENQP